MANYEKFERHVGGGCPTRAFEEAEITVPVIVRAHAEVHNVEIKCMGEPHIKCHSSVTPGRVGAESRFTVSERIRIEIPIDFHAETDIGQGHVKYKHCHNRDECPDNGNDNNDEDNDNDDDDEDNDDQRAAGNRYNCAGRQRR